MCSTPIKTLVIFDIETTGLPHEERNQTKITDYCFLAVHRQDILRSPAGQTPLSCKLSCVVNPQRKIQPKAAELTGLTNDSLAHAPGFHQHVDTISTFLANLPKPVCLVAHNGNQFDYKILLAEFNDASASLPTDLLCLDSLHGFRTLLKGTAINHATLSAENNVDNLQNSQQLLNTGTAADNSKAPKQSFALGSLYKRLLNKEMNAHRAEADCIMLLECVIAMKREFLDWADTHCELLTLIEPIRQQSIQSFACGL